ncbi:Mannosylfructose-phosphate synthase [Fundidesulfovibrio magnetotacticus]|uniref:Mannosylfructose-phosphate synthase n=1 Tax=Fundidesulfovibrio magnetotacticus TaxID=2730080 RepID=A0A6V8LPZ7_9BACT|nr:glycosyltransferase family 1 protein [Fundidesulfovibrio magnetotacticus]GFK92631.1 Mannosylfructose-phosphate synthase [Fundidesulfovibrio magnetotacticus]
MNEDFKAVIRDLSTGFRAEAPLPAFFERLLLNVPKLWRWWDMGLKGLGRTFPALCAGRRPGESPLVAVDLWPLLPGGANGGAKVFTLVLLETMAAMAPERTFVLVANPAALDELRALEAPNLKVLPARKQWLARPPKKLLGRPIDAWFCPFTRPYFQDPAIPLVSVIYDLQYHYYPQFFSDEERRGRDQTFQLAARRSARLACISDYVRSTVLEYGKLPPEKARTVHILIPRRLTPPSEAETRAVLDRLGLSPKGYFIYPANFWPHKNHAVLLTAFSLFARAHPDAPVKLVLTGADTGQAQALKEAARAMGVAERTLFTGYVSDDDLAALTAASLALVFPSLFEGYGMPVAEAMSLGVPVACSDVTSLPEVGGDAVLLFDPRKPEDVAQTLARLALEPGLAAELSARGLARAAAMGGPQDMAQAYLDLLDEALRGLGAQSHALDGIAGGRVSGPVFAAFGPASGRQWIEARFVNHGPEPVAVRASLDGKPLPVPATLAPGASLDIRRLASPYGGCLDIAFENPRDVRCDRLALAGSHPLDLLETPCRP